MGFRDKIMGFDCFLQTVSLVRLIFIKLMKLLFRTSFVYYWIENYVHLCQLDPIYLTSDSISENISSNTRPMLYS